MQNVLNDSSSIDYLIALIKTKSAFETINGVQDLISNLTSIVMSFDSRRIVVANLFQESHLDVS